MKSMKCRCVEPCLVCNKSDKYISGWPLKMLSKASLLLLFALVVLVPLKAQEQCGFMQTLGDCNAPTLTIESVEGTDCKSLDTGDYIIPVVFHIMYNNPVGEENISDDRVHEVLDYLNRKFTSDNEGTVFNQSVRFELASFDPDGNCATGINHVQVDSQFSAGIVKDTWVDGSQDQAFKNQSYWNNQEYQYMNVWIVSAILECHGTEASIQGYSSFPFSLGETTIDGLVIF